MNSGDRLPAVTRLDRWGRLADVPLYAVTLLSASLFAVPSMRSAVHEPPWLLFTLNVLFVAPVCLWVAVLALRAYLVGGFARILLAGSGILVFGLANFISGFLIFDAVGNNAAVTVHNLGVMASAVLHLSGCLLNIRGAGPEESQQARVSKAVLVYGAVSVFTALMWLGSVYDLLPPFVVPGGDITPVRLVVLAASIVLFAVSALIVCIDFERRRAPFLLWYGLGLALIALGLLGVMLAIPGSILGWTGRASQYLGNLYLFAAAWILVRDARRAGLDIEQAVAEFFRRSESHYRALVDASTSAIVSVDPSGKIILWNRAAETCFGLSPGEAVGMDLAGAIAVPENEKHLRDIVAGKQETRLETTLRRKDGKTFPASLSAYASESDRSLATTFIIRDITQRKAAEEVLKASEARYRSLSETSPDAVIVHRGGRFVYANEQALRLYGAACFEELASKGIFELMHPDDRAGIQDRVQRVTGGEATPLREVRLLRIDGSAVATEAAGAPILFEGQPAVQVVIRDITERKQAEAALREGEQQLRLVMDTVPALMSYVDTQFRYRRVNEEYGRWFGMAAHEIEGRHVRDIIGEEAWLPVRPRLEQVLSGETVTFEERMPYRTGGTRWTHATLVPDRDASGRVRGFVGLVADITGRKRVEEALREQTERYRLVVEGAHAAIWDWDIPNRRVFYSPRWKELRGFAEDEITDEEKEWSERIHPEDAPRVHAALQAHFDGKTEVFAEEYRIRCKDGAWKWVVDRGVALRDESGRVVRMAGSETDITERKRAEEQLLRAKQLSDSLNRIGAALHSTLDTDEVMRRFISEGVAALGSDTAAVSLRVDGGWAPAHVHGMPGDLVDARMSDDEERHAVLAAESRRPVAVEDAFNDERFNREHLRRHNIRSVLVAPLMARGRVTGVIFFNYQREARQFTDAEVAFAEQIASAASAALENASLFEERKHAEAAIEEARKSLERERDLLQAVMDGATNSNLAYLDRDFNFLRVNEAYARSSGYKPEEMIGRNHFALFPHAENEAVFARVRDTGEPAQFHDRPFVYTDQPERGVTFWDWTLTPIADGAGRVQGLVLSLFETTWRKQAEQRLRESEERFRTLAEAAFEGIAVTERGAFLDVSDQLCRLTGYDRAELMGKTASDLTHPEDRARVTENILAGREIITEHRLIRKDGSVIVVEAHGKTIRQGDRERRFTSIRDVTGQKAAEAAIRQSEARFRLLVGTAGRLLASGNPQGIVEDLCRDVMEHLDCQAFFNFMVDDQEGRLRLNACAGIPEEEIRKLEWLDYGVAVCGCVARDKVRIVAEDIFHTPDERTELVKSYGIRAYCCHPLMAGGRLVGTLSFGTKTRDRFTPDEVDLMRAVADQVSVAMERIRAVEAVRESEGRLRAVVDNLPVGIWFADGTGKILYGNPAGRRIWAGARLVGPGEFHDYRAWWADTGKPLAPEDWAIARAIRTGEASLGETLVIQCFDGSKKTIINSAVPFFSPGGDLAGVVVLNEDITQRRAAEATLRDSMAMLRMAQQAARAGLWHWDMTADKLTWSEEFHSLFGLAPAAEASFDTWLAAMLPEDREMAMDRIRRSMADRAPLENEYRIALPDGRQRWIRAAGRTIYDGQGRAMSMSGICIDITEKKAAENALQESEERYRTLFNEMNEGFALHEIVLDDRGEPADYRFLEVNPAFERTTGLRAADVVGKPVTDVLPGTEPFWIRTFGEVALTGKAVHFENHSAALDKDFEVFAYRPAPGRFAVIFLDITDRLRAERALRRSEEDLNRAQAVARTGSWRMDVQKNELHWSDENHRIFGVPKGMPMTYETFLAIVHPDDRDYVDRCWMAALRGEPYDIEHRLVVNGEVKWVRETADLEFEGDGSLRGGFGTTQDITERKRAEAQMERLASFPLLNPNPVIEVDLEGRVTFTNPAAWKLFPDLGKRGMSHPWLADWKALVAMAGKEGSTRHVREVNVDGRWYHQSLQFVEKGPSLRIYGWDITERKAADAALRRANEDLEQRVRERTAELVALTENLTTSRDHLRALASELTLAEEQQRKRISATLHDEVAQTLAAAKMRLDLLRSGGEDATSHRALTEARELLEQSIRETRALMTDISPPLLFDMGLPAACESLAEKLTARHGIPIRCDISEDLADVSQEMRIVTFQAIRELLTNAMKHSGASSVRVAIESRNRQLLVRVTDNGTGFDPKSVQGPTDQGGFGLFSIRERIVAFNGIMTVESNPESGTEVTIALPRDTKAPPAGQKKGKSLRARPSQGKTP